MLGTRIGGIVSADLRMKGWGKIVSLAPKVIDFLAEFFFADSLQQGHITDSFSLPSHNASFNLDQLARRHRIKAVAYFSQWN